MWHKYDRITKKGYSPFTIWRFQGSGRFAVFWHAQNFPEAAGLVTQNRPCIYGQTEQPDWGSVVKPPPENRNQNKIGSNCRMEATVQVPRNRLAETFPLASRCIIWGHNSGNHVRFHGKYMVYFTFSRHKMADFTNSRFSLIYFQIEAAKKRSRKI